MSNSIWQNGHYRPRPDKYKHKKPKSRNPWSPNYDDSLEKEDTTLFMPQDYSQGYVNPYINTPDAPVFDTPSAQDNAENLQNFMNSNKPPQFQNRWKRQPERFTFSQPIEKCSCEPKQEGFEYDINENARLPHSRVGLGFEGEDFVVKSEKKMPALETPVLSKGKPIWERIITNELRNVPKWKQANKDFSTEDPDPDILLGKCLFNGKERGGIYNPYEAYIEEIEKEITEKERERVEGKNITQLDTSIKELKEEKEIMLARKNQVAKALGGNKNSNYKGLKDNDPQLYAYIESAIKKINRKILSGKDNNGEKTYKETPAQMCIFIYVKDKPTINSGGGGVAYTYHLPYANFPESQSRGTYKDKPITIPYINPRRRKEIKDFSKTGTCGAVPGFEIVLSQENADPIDQNLANEFGDVMFCLEYNQESVELDKQAIKSEKGYKKRYDSVYSFAVEEVYKIRMRGGMSPESYPLPLKK